MTRLPGTRGAEGLTPSLAAHFATIALGHVSREYPNKPEHVLAGPADAQTPAALHPVFFGSYDWHSCVHGFWMLARLLRAYPDLPQAGAIHALFDARITPAAVGAECVYLAAPTARAFKRPYGWAWLLKLAAELSHHPQAWGPTLSPLSEVFAQRFRDFLPIATYPVRVGTHFNTAFALRLAADYAEATRDDALMTLLRRTAWRWYDADAEAPAWGEPSGDDFLSGTLIEAECLRRLLPAGTFLPWFDAFLPRLAAGQPATLFRPAKVSDRTDGKIAHLDGLNLSRAWCWRALAGALPEGDARRPGMLDTAEAHLACALPQVAGDYMGEHWLASFATLALLGGSAA